MHRQCWVVFLLFISVGFMLGCFGSGITVLLPQSLDTLENTDATLSCSYTGNEPVGYFIWYMKNQHSAVANCKPSDWLSNTTLYSYNCPNNTFHVVTLKSISQQRNMEVWKCSFVTMNGQFVNSTETMIFVKVPVKSVVISPSTSILTKTENVTLEFQCISSPCRPKPIFRWYVVTPEDEEQTLIEINPDGNSDEIESYSTNFSITLNRTWNDLRLHCGAQIEADGFVLSQKILINVTYPPNGRPSIGKFENGREINVIKDKFVYLECSVSGGNPLPALEWNKNNDIPQTVSGSVVTRGINWTAIDITRDKLECQSIHPEMTATAYVTVNVLFPPGNAVLSLRNISGEYLVIVNTITIIENDQLFLNCSAESNPPVSTFEWKGVMNSTNSSLHINNIRRNQTGDLICNAYNIMKLTEPDQTVIGHINSTLLIDVLYPPKVSTFDEKIIAEGEDLVYPCNFTPGNPNSTKLEWRREKNAWGTTQQQLQQQQQLELTQVSRNQSGIYTCSAINKMIATDGHEIVGNGSGNLKLIVEYQAKVQSFVVEGYEMTNNVTVNENETVRLVCTIEGHPLPTGELSFRKADYLQRTKTEIHFQNTTINDSETLQVDRLFKAQCTDSGINTCTGTNKLYTGLVTVGTLNMSLNVNCKPRKSPFHRFPSGDIVVSPTLATVTLNFTALAYPIPPVSAYVWSRQTNETMSKWTTIISSDTSLVISTSGLQSNLTIKNVTPFDFGLYKVMVENEIGSYEHIFNFTAPGKPEAPKDFRNIKESITESSASFEWRPSFNGGLKQSFVLTYAQTDHQTTWMEIAIPEADSDLMTYVATNLSSGTTYDFKIFARNDIGNSSSETITLTTKSHQNKSSSSFPIVAAAGGASAGAAILVIFIALVVTCRKRSREKKMPKENSRNRFQNLNNDSSCNTKTDVYEGLQNKGFGPQYEQVSAAASKNKKEQHMVYENLQLKCINNVPRVAEQAGSPVLDAVTIQSVV